MTMQNITMECDVLFDVTKADDQYKLSDFTFKNLDLKVKKNAKIEVDCVDNFVLENVKVNDNIIRKQVLDFK